MDQDRSDYRSMLGIALLWACATAGPFSVLALILRQNGLDVQSIGYVMAASTVAMFVGSLISGWAVVRYGPLRVALVAILCTGTALLSFEWTAASAVAAMASRVLQGLGFGLMMTAGISYVQSKVPESNHPHAIALYSAMSVTSYFFAQWEAEAYLDRFGWHGVFALHSIFFIPVLVLAVYLLPREKRVREKPKGASYGTVLAVPQVYPPYLCMFLNGMLFGFGASFMPIMLRDSMIRLGFYFMSFAILTLGTRFFLMRRLQKLPKPLLLALGMGSMGLGCLCPILSLTTPSIVLSGVLYGFGYAFIGPMVTTTVSQFFTPTERPRAVALTQTFFQAGSVIAPIMAAYAMVRMGSIALPLFMSLIGLMSIAMGVFVLILNSGPVVESRRA